MSSDQVLPHFTSDRPFTVVTERDPLNDLIAERGRLICARLRPEESLDDIDEALEFGGQVVFVFEGDTAYVYEVPTDVNLSPSFHLDETVEVVGIEGRVQWRALILALEDGTIYTSCNHTWTLDGKLIDGQVASCHLQLRRRYASLAGRGQRR